MSTEWYLKPMPCLDYSFASFASFGRTISPLRWPDPTWRKFRECSWVLSLIKDEQCTLPTKAIDIHCSCMAWKIVMEHVLNDHIITFIIVVTVEVLRWEKDQEDAKSRFILLVYEGGIVPSILYQFWVLYMSKCSTWYLMAGDVERVWVGRYLGNLAHLWRNWKPENWATSKYRRCIAW